MVRFSIGMLVGITLAPYLPPDFWHQVVIRFANHLQNLAELLKSFV